MINRNVQNEIFEETHSYKTLLIRSFCLLVQFSTAEIEIV